MTYQQVLADEIFTTGVNMCHIKKC